MKELQEQSAGAVVYHLTKDGQIRYLLLLPRQKKPWGFPKGKINPSETPPEAARREILEEAGIAELDFDPDFCQVVHYAFTRGETTIAKEVTYYLAGVPSYNVRISGEHVAYRWVTIEEGLKLVTFETTRDLLNMADQHIRQRHQISETR